LKFRQASDLVLACGWVANVEVEAGAVFKAEVPERLDNLGKGVVVPPSQHPGTKAVGFPEAHPKALASSLNNLLVCVVITEAVHGGSHVPGCKVCAAIATVPIQIVEAHPHGADALATPEAVLGECVAMLLRLWIEPRRELHR